MQYSFYKKFVSYSILIITLTLLFGTLPSSAQPSFRFDVQMGIDVVVDSSFKQFTGKKVLLLTNQAGRTRDLRSTAELFATSSECRLVGIMTPEHGYYGNFRAGDSVKGGDSIAGVPIFSLYGALRKPSPELLAMADIIVADLQDIGIRSYTFLSTLYNTMDACADANKPLVILDRPNPFGGNIIDGNVLDTTVRSFVGIIPIPYIHGCTLGELALMINGEGWLPRQQPVAAPGDKKRKVTDAFLPPKTCSLTVIPMERWERWMVWEDTDFTWIPTSPHIPSVSAIRGAAVLGPLGELGIMNIGIGYTSPFQFLGNPDFNTTLFSEFLAREQFPGIHFTPTHYIPFYGALQGKLCKGYYITFSPSLSFAPYSAGIELLAALRRSNPSLFEIFTKDPKSSEMFAKVVGSRPLADALLKEGNYSQVQELLTTNIEQYKILREKYLLYR